MKTDRRCWRIVTGPVADDLRAQGFQTKLNPRPARRAPSRNGAYLALCTGAELYAVERARAQELDRVRAAVRAAEIAAQRV